jgi:hypothetical protein
MTWRIDRNAVAAREARGSSILSRRLPVSGSLANAWVAASRLTAGATPSAERRSAGVRVVSSDAN